MHFAFSEEQEQLRRGARRFLEAHASDGDVWRRIGGELGWTALAIPEAHGGAGLGQVELVAILEEMGRALLRSPFYATVCLGANAIGAAGDAAQAARWLPGIAAGGLSATLAYAGPGGRWDAAAVEAVARPDGQGGAVIDGKYAGVLDGAAADLLIVAARAPGSVGEAGVSLYAVLGASAGIARRALVGLDESRPMAELSFAGVRVDADARLGGEGEGWPILSRTLELAAVGLAAEQLGGAQRCLEMAVDYAKTRVQFGRAIGSFQAVKHKCADLFVAVESARSAAYWAGWAAASDAPERTLAAATAKAFCGDAFWKCAAENLQIHGGIGFTWEHMAHRYLRRARVTQTLFGDAAYQRELVARQLWGWGGPDGPTLL